MTISLIFAGILLCIVFSGFFSATEMALSSANTLRLENEAEDGNKKASLALSLIENFDTTLSAILIGNNLVNIAASSLASVAVIELTGSDKKTWIATAVITILVIIFGETIPKITAKRVANDFSLFASPVIRLIGIILKPVIALVVYLVHLCTALIPEQKAGIEDEAEEAVEELASIIDTAEDEGVFDSDQSERLQAALDFDDTSAYEVMTSRVDMEAIDIDDDIDEILRYIETVPYSRLPVYEDSIDNIIGTLHLNHLLKALARDEKADIRSLLMPPLFVYKTTRLPVVLRELKQARQHLAIVTDEYSGTMGVITMEDVLEEIVGDIWDETDIIEEEVLEHSSNEWELDGDMNIYDFMDLVGIREDDFEGESETVGGFVIELLERFPDEGDTVSYEDMLTFKVLEMEGRRVLRVLVTKNLSSVLTETL